jgi:hypothetical protein
MLIENILLTDHFIKRIKDRNIPFELVVDCLKNGKEVYNNRNRIFDNKLVSCYMSLVDGAGLTVKLSRKISNQIRRDARKYGTSLRKMTFLYFKSLGYFSEAI